MCSFRGRWFYFLLSEDPPRERAGAVEKNRGGGSCFVAVPVADPVAGRCEFSGGGSSFFLILTLFTLCIERGKKRLTESFFSYIF